MSADQKAGVGCVCGWPLDSCNPAYADGEPCGEQRHRSGFNQPPFVIWKFLLPSSRTVIHIPEGARLLSVGAQGSSIVVWVEVTPSNVYEQRVIGAFNTGAQLSADRKAFIGTVQIGGVEDNPIVWHVYEVAT